LRPVECVAHIEREHTGFMGYRAGVYVAWGAALHDVRRSGEHGETIREACERISDALAVGLDVLADALAARK
jgi:predicted RNase H-like HicB family nuclease